MSGLLGGAGGWFDQVANGCTSVGRLVGLGDFYDHHMIPAANQLMNNVNDSACQSAVNAGKTQIQALQAANVKLATYSDPQTLADVGGLVKTGGNIACTAVNNAMTSDPVDQLTPLLIGAGLLGAGYMVANAFSGPSSPTVPQARESRLERA